MKKSISRKILDKAAKVRLVCSDVDGVLTDGGMYYSNQGEELKKFNTRDGMAVAMLKAAGIEVILGTGENTGILSQRANKLNIEEIYQGINNKLTIVESLASKRGYTAEHLAFIEDDINDLEAIRFCGFGGTVADGIDLIKSNVDFICEKNGGEGAFREFAEIILTAQGKL